MGKKMRMRIADTHGWKETQVRENLTANNLEAIIKGQVQSNAEYTQITWKGNRISGNRKLKDIGIADGDQICIEEVRPEVTGTVNARMNQKSTLAKDEKDYNKIIEDAD